MSFGQDNKIFKMKEKIKQYFDLFSKQIEKVSVLSDLEVLENDFFARKTGKISLLMKQVKSLSDNERKEIGNILNETKEKMFSEILRKKQELKRKEKDEIEESEKIDTTEPLLPKTEYGSMHPNSIIENELYDLFTSMGFLVLSGPELESDYYNFEALNIPKTHPARDSQDTFFIKNHPDWVMRTHTSPVQVRAMQKYGAPLRAVVPGRCFRNEATDACHEHTFYQLEGLVVDKEISIANLISVMKGLLSGILKKDVEIRLRPGYFPFVEPGFELDMRCQVCSGKGCGACKNSGWIETIPCGLVHPKVLEYGGLDSKKWSGFAFGLGMTRLVMQKYGIEDIRLLQSGDLRFLKQF
jgi:phenylalanyl-tRNA synthetase alpha chain